MATISEGLHGRADATFRACLRASDPELLDTRLVFTETGMQTSCHPERPAAQQALFDVGYTAAITDEITLAERKVRSAAFFRTIAATLPLITTHEEVCNLGEAHTVVDTNLALAGFGLKSTKKYLRGAERYIYTGEPVLPRGSTPRDLIGRANAPTTPHGSKGHRYHLRLFSDTRPKPNPMYYLEWSGTPRDGGIEWVSNITIRPTSAIQKALTFYNPWDDRDDETLATQVSYGDAQKIHAILASVKDATEHTHV